MSLRVYYEVLNQKGTPALYTDTLANRPAFGFQGRLFVSTDSGQIFEDTGTAWTLVADAGVGGGTLSSVCLNGNTTATGIVITAGGLSSNSITNTSNTAGSVLFAGTSGLESQSNATFFWDNTNKRLGIGNASPGASLDIHGTGTLIQLNGTTTNNSFVQFQNAGTSKWRIGNLYNAGANSFQVYDDTNTTARLTILNTGATTINGALTSTSVAITGGTSAQILAANGSVITAGTNITISGGTISSSGGGGGITTLNTLTATTQTFATGTSGSDFNIVSATSTHTFNIPTASATNRGALSSADWTTFNNKQGALTNPITGTGTRTTTYLPLFSGTDTIQNSSISETVLTGVFVANTLNVQNPLTVTSYVTADAFIPSNSTVPTNGMYLSAANTLAFATNTGNRLTISSTGAATFSSTVSAVGNINIQDSSVLNLGYNQGGGATLQYNSNGNLDITPRSGYSTIFTAGNVGIATTTIGSKLQVNGNAAIGYSASTSAPTNGLAVSGAVAIGQSTVASGIKLDILNSGGVLQATGTDAGSTVFILKNTNASFNNSLFYGVTTRTSSSAFRLFDVRTNNGSTEVFIVDGTGAITSASTVTSTQYRLSALNTAPTTSTSTGTLGEIRIDGTAIYVCTATNTWVRALLTTF